ncbi:30S ribosomal protein S11 [candidate division WOR-3 bacterium]|nr:30S ribosomal protein S11 [candidate division WOR-3 bacterium]
MARKRTRRKKTRFPESGIVKIFATFNNTIVSIGDFEGNILVWTSGGRIGFKGAKKGTPFAAQQATESAAREAASQGLKKVEVYVKGPGPGREAAIRSIQNAGLQITRIVDTTPIPHNGCRPPKQRRI